MVWRGILWALKFGIYRLDYRCLFEYLLPSENFVRLEEIQGKKFVCFSFQESGIEEYVDLEGINEISVAFFPFF